MYASGYYCSKWPLWFFEVTAKILDHLYLQKTLYTGQCWDDSCWRGLQLLFELSASLQVTSVKVRGTDNVKEQRSKEELKSTLILWNIMQRVLTLDMSYISLMTYWCPSSLDLTRMAFPNPPFPILSTSLYFSMLVEWLMLQRDKHSWLNKCTELTTVKLQWITSSELHI